MHNLIEYGGDGCPVKYTTSPANMFASGEPLDPGLFTTEEAVNYLRSLGFNVVEVRGRESTKRRT